MKFSLAHVSFCCLAALVLCSPGFPAEHPGLLLTPEDIEFIRQHR